MNSQWMQLLYVIVAALVIWLAFKMIRGNPQLFSKENIAKSFFSIGVLTLILMAFIAALVYFLKH